MAEHRSNERRAVCVHGAGGGGWEWTLWARVLAARGWAVRAPDLQSGARGLPATTLSEYVEQVRLWSTPAPDLVVGASLGGLLALLAAAVSPPRALVLVNALPPRGVAPSVPCGAPWPAVVPWGRTRSLAGTRRALPDADPAACLCAWRRWRDESGAVLNAARDAVAVRPDCPTLVLASRDDTDVPADRSRALAEWLGADLLVVDGSHVGPLLGRRAAAIAAQVAVWAERRLRPRNGR